MRLVLQLLLMPEDPNSVLICVATGTGIAPFRSFWRRCFYEDVPGWKFTGLFWLFMGAANGDAKLYDDELQEILATCVSPRAENAVRAVIRNAGELCTEVCVWRSCCGGGRGCGPAALPHMHGTAAVVVRT